MANHKSAIKRNRQNTKRRAANKSARTAIRSAAKGVRAVIESDDAKAALAALREAEKVLATAAAKRLVHPKNASRKISRLAKAVNAAQAKAAAK